MADKLAVDGGQPVVPAGTIKSWPPITQQDRDAVLAVFDSDQFHGTSAPNAMKLRERWAEYCGVKHCLVTNGGTATLHMAMTAAEIGPGDEVITSAFTYWSTAAGVLHNNAIPVFADIDPLSYTLDPALIEERITPRTKAILPIHIHGMPADMDPINAVAKKHGLVVIEDACQAAGASYKGRKTGSLGDIGCFSTNRSKNLSGGEGGLWTTSNDAYFTIANRMWHFNEIEVPDDAGGHTATVLGWNYRPHEFINAFILAQLDRLEEYNAIRRQYANWLTGQLAEIPGFRGPHTPDYADPNYFCYVVEFCPEELGLDCSPLEWKQAVQKAVAAEGFGLGQWQSVPVPGQDVFQARRGYGKGCPWTCPFGSGEVRYDASEYPKTQAFINSHAYLGGVYPPNTMELMHQYVAGFQKLSANAPRVLELWRAG